MAFEEKVKNMQGAAYATVKIFSLVDDQENCIAKGSVSDIHHAICSIFMYLANRISRIHTSEILLFNDPLL